jgi:predicted ester cyclase
MSIMKNSIHAAAVEKEAGQVVLAFIKALNEEDFTAAKKYVKDSLTFEGVMGSRHGAAAYFKDMEQMKFKYDVKKVFVNGDEVAVFYDINMGNGKNIFSAGWYHLEDGKIVLFKVVFDPRPLLESKPPEHAKAN